MPSSPHNKFFSKSMTWNFAKKLPSLSMHYQTKQSKRHIKFYEHTHLFLFSYLWPINLQASKTTNTSQNTYFWVITLHLITYVLEILSELFDPQLNIELEGVILMLKFFLSYEYELGQKGCRCGLRIVFVLKKFQCIVSTSSSMSWRCVTHRGLLWLWSTLKTSLTDSWFARSE